MQFKVPFWVRWLDKNASQIAPIFWGEWDTQSSDDMSIYRSDKLGGDISPQQSHMGDFWRISWQNKPLNKLRHLAWESCSNLCQKSSHICGLWYGAVSTWTFCPTFTALFLPKWFTKMLPYMATKRNLAIWMSQFRGGKKKGIRGGDATSA